MAQTLIEDLVPLPVLPNRFRPEDGQPLPQGIIGSTILCFGGAPVTADLEGGGLVIDYIPAGHTEVLRAALSFCENGMWLTALGSLDLSLVRDPSILGAGQ